MTWKRAAFIGGAILLAGAAATWLAFEAALIPLRAQAFTLGTVVQTASGPIEYAEAGTGPPLLVIHGASGGYDQGLLIATGLVGDNFRIIAPSRFGYLQTPLPGDASPAAQADAHAALMDALQVQRAVVVGVSAGAPSAVQLALRHPDRVAALMLFSPLGYAPGEQAPLPGGRTALWLNGRGADFAYWAMLHLKPRSLIRLLGVPPELLEHAEDDDRRLVHQLLHSVLPLSPRVAGIANDLAVRNLVRTERWPLEEIRAPTLILTCSDDLFGTQAAAEYAAQRIPGARLAVFPTGGHLFIGHREEVRAAARGWALGR